MAPPCCVPSGKDRRFFFSWMNRETRRRRRALNIPPARKDKRLPFKPGIKCIIYGNVRRQECIWFLYNNEKCFAGVTSRAAIHKKSTEQSCVVQQSSVSCSAADSPPGLSFSQWSTSVQLVHDDVNITFFSYYLSRPDGM